MAQLVKNLPAMQETWVQSLGWEDPLEKGMATHSSILAWRIPWIEEPGGLQSTGSHRVTQLKRLSTHTCHRLRVKCHKTALLFGCKQRVLSFPTFLSNLATNQIP